MNPKSHYANAKGYYAHGHHLQRETNQDNAWLYDYIAALGVESVFEFGCNMGRHLIELRRRGCTVSGVDINQRAIDEARTVHGLDVRYGDESALADIGDGAFDLTLTNSVLCHMPDVGETIAHLTRIARHHALFVETRSRTDAERFWWVHDYPGECVRSYHAPVVGAVYQVWHLRVGEHG